MQKDEGENSKRYDLEERIYEFARRVRAFIKRLNKHLWSDRPQVRVNVDHSSIRTLNLFRISKFEIRV